MSSDIDQFIRDQKSKISAERQYLAQYQTPRNEEGKRKSKNIDTVENFKQVNQRPENTFKFSEQLTPRTENIVNINDPDEGGLLHGLRYSNSAQKRKEKIRNEEYNDFKRIDEEKFRNRFANKKGSPVKLEPAQQTSPTVVQRKPMTDFAQNTPRPTNRILLEKSTQHQFRNPPVNEGPKVYNRMFESKLEELEKKVEELRKFRVENPFIIYPRDKSPSYASQNYREPAVATTVPAAHNYQDQSNLRYSNTNLGRNHVKYIDDVEKKLQDIEEKYSSTKSQILNTYKNSRNTFPRILDDEGLMEEEKFNGDVSYNKKSARHYDSTEGSIIPLGKLNAEELDKKKKEAYRKDLLSQMKNKSVKKSNETAEEESFFDKFGQNRSRTNKTFNAESDHLKDSNEYQYYASHNPLEAYGKSHNEVRFKSESNTPYNDIFGSIDTKKSTLPYHDEPFKPNSHRTDDYALELKRQIEERKLRKEAEKQKELEYEKKKNDEIANYHPFGRGGGGAPLKNTKGDTVADLRKVLHNGSYSGETEIPPPVVSVPEYHALSITPAPAQLATARDNGNFVRGGHGIFGTPLSNEDKEKAERYKEELMIQIDLKKKQKEIEKENERQREEKELQRIEQQQKEIQVQYEQERLTQQKKEQEKLRQLEESRKAALEEKQKMKKSKEITEEEIQRPVSPKYEPNSYREIEKTPLELEATYRPALQREDSKIMGQILKLRNQLQSEKQRIENALLKQKDEVEIFDARLNQPKAPTTNHKQSKENQVSDVFQAVLDKKGPLSVRRNQPLKDQTGVNLDEYLKEQEKILNRMSKNDFSELELNMPKMDPYNVGMRPPSQFSNQLDSESDFIRFYQSNDLSRDSVILNQDYNMEKSSTATPKKLSRRGSDVSLNIEELTRKNRERLRKLQKLQDENESNQSSDEILNKIISSETESSDMIFQ